MGFEPVAFASVPISYNYLLDRQTTTVHETNREALNLLLTGNGKRMCELNEQSQTNHNSY